MSNTTYYRYKEQGLCVKCGGERDRNGVICKTCLDKSNERSRKDYQFYLDMGTCPICRKEKLFGDEKSCPECKARKTNNNSIRVSKNENEIRKKIAERDAKRYYERKNNGLCVECGKNNDSGFALCKICRVKRNKERKYTYRTDRKEWIRKGLCYWCGKQAVKPYKLCQTHLDAIRKTANLPQTQKAREENIKAGILR